MSRLAIRQLHYRGSKFHYSSPVLGDGLQILSGRNGTGKTTFVQLLYYGLGGRSEFIDDSRHLHREIASDSNNSVSLLISINDADFELRRYIGANDIAVHTLADDSVEILPVNRSKTQPRIFSDWILERLSIRPVEVWQGFSSWRTNITDLMRLMYYDQSSDPHKIYKAKGTEGLYSDSAEMRRIIFELLVGESQVEYYDALAGLRSADASVADRRSRLLGFQEAIRRIGGDEHHHEMPALRARMAELTSQLERLTTMRKSVREVPPIRGRADDATSQIEEELAALSLAASQLKRRRADLLDEQTQLQRLRENVVLEVTQLKKALFTHEKLGIFDDATCSICLRRLARDHDAAPNIELPQLAAVPERFVYDSREYIDILKSKQKSVDTVVAAIVDCARELERLQAEALEMDQRSLRLQQTYQDAVRSLSSEFDLSQLNAIDNQILSLREEALQNQQRLQLNIEQQELADELSQSEAIRKRAQIDVDRLRERVEGNLKDRVDRLSRIYNDLMVEALKDCPSARLDDEYMPVIGAGEYREESASVPKRMMYFLSLLVLSLEDSRVPFPRFLLIDTPEDAGIDDEALMRCVTLLRSSIPADASGYQILLTTGEEKYPDEFEMFLFDHLKESDRLLKPNDDSSVN